MVAVMIADDLILRRARRRLRREADHLKRQMIAWPCETNTARWLAASERVASIEALLERDVRASEDHAAAAMTMDAHAGRIERGYAANLGMGPN